MNKLLFLLSLPMLVLIASCSSDGAFSVEDGLIDVSTKLTVIDTTTLYTYTVKSDSIVESASQKLLVGRYNDGELGTVTAKSYFEIGYSSTVSVEKTAVYDSISLILTNSGYSYGDTTKLFNLVVHQLTENLADNPNVSNQSPSLAGYRYNTSIVAYDSINALGQTAYYPRPNTNKALHIKLSDNFGIPLFDSIMAKSKIASDLGKFVRYFKGIVLTTDKSSLSSVQRFSTADSSLYVRMYYHVDKVDKSISFLMENSTSRPYELPFNQVKSDYSTSKLKQLKHLENKLSSLVTDSLYYCQPGVGIMSRIEMPYLKNVLHTNGNIKIMKAQLILFPARNSYKTINLPKRIALYEANELNKVGSLVNDTTTAQLTIDNFNNESTFYTIDVTSYIATVLANSTDVTPVLMVTLPAGKTATTLDRIIFANGLGLPNSTRSKLKILYWKY
jgi:hypothetical protein